MRKSLQEIAKESIRSLIERRKFSQRELAKKVKLSAPVVNRIIRRDQPVTLRLVEAAAELANVSPLELLVEPDVELKAINPLEAQMLRYFRDWPLSTRMGLLTFASFFADEPPATHDERRAREQIRRLPDGKRRVVYAYLTMLTEGFLPGEDLPQDIRKGLGLPETSAPLSTRTEKAKRRTNQT